MWNSIAFSPGLSNSVSCLAMVYSCGIISLRVPISTDCVRLVLFLFNDYSCRIVNQQLSIFPSITDHAFRPEKGDSVYPSAGARGKIDKL